MAIVSRKEFAEMCGDDVKTLNVYINRRKVIMHDPEGKKIDTENLVNLLYKKKRHEINKAKKEDAEIAKQIIANPRKNVTEESNNGDDDDEDNSSDADFVSEMMKGFAGESGFSGGQSPMLKKLIKDTELVELKIQKEKILLDKAAGKLIPIDVAANLLRSQALFIFSNFDNAIENIAGVYCQIMANGDMSLYARIVEEGKKQLKAAIERAGSDVDSDLEKIVNEFSQHSATRVL